MLFLLLGVIVARFAGDLCAFLQLRHGGLVQTGGVGAIVQIDVQELDGHHAS